METLFQVSSGGNIWSQKKSLKLTTDPVVDKNSVFAAAEESDAEAESQ